MRLSEAVDALLIATRADGRSPRTVRAYEEKLAPLVKALGPAADVTEITVGDLRRYVTGLYQRKGKHGGPVSDFTVASWVRNMRRLFAFLEAEGELTSNPARRVRVPTPRRIEPKGIAWADVEAMLTSTAGGSLTDLRDRAILLFLSDTGCRAGGLVGLRVGDVDLARGRAIVTEKGGRPRPVWFGRVTREALADLLALRSQDPGARVFVSRNPGHRPLTPDDLTQILKRRADKAGVDRARVSAHRFRHAFARAYLQHGGDLATCSALLGHASVEVTRQFYAVFSESELREAHGRHSPVRQLEAAGPSDYGSRTRATD